MGTNYLYDRRLFLAVTGTVLSGCLKGESPDKTLSSGEEVTHNGIRATVLGYETLTDYTEADEEEPKYPSTGEVFLFLKISATNVGGTAGYPPSNGVGVSGGGTAYSNLDIRIHSNLVNDKGPTTRTSLIPEEYVTSNNRRYYLYQHDLDSKTIEGGYVGEIPADTAVSGWLMFSIREDFDPAETIATISLGEKDFQWKLQEYI